MRVFLDPEKALRHGTQILILGTAWHPDSRSPREGGNTFECLFLSQPIRRVLETQRSECGFPRPLVLEAPLLRRRLVTRLKKRPSECPLVFSHLPRPILNSTLEQVPVLSLSNFSVKCRSPGKVSKLIRSRKGPVPGPCGIAHRIQTWQQRADQRGTFSFKRPYGMFPNRTE